MPQPSPARIPANQVSCGIALLLAVVLLANAPAQELSRLPPVKDDAGTWNDVQDLRQRIGELEATLAEIQGQPVVSFDEPVESAAFWQQECPSVPPVKFASFGESLLAGDFSIDIGGYVKADFIHDFNAIGSTDTFDPATIPTDGRRGENTRLHARQTRLNLDYRPHADCDDLRLFIEGDFFGTTEPFRRGRAFLRLRHAYVRAGRLLAGQTWSTFMDESILPSTLDFESPRSIILDRRALLRWTQPVTESLALAVALEDPRPNFDLTAALPGDIERPSPDLISRVRYETTWGHLQVAGLVRLLRYRLVSDATDDAAGWGFNFTGLVHPHEFDSVLFQFAFGDGIESYRQGTDAAVDASGSVEVIPVIAWVVGYEVDWADRISSTFVYSSGRVTNAGSQLPSAGKAGEYVAANIIFEPRPRLSYGVEYLYGTRTDKGDSSGEAHRLQFSVRYDLP